ncbi:cilia- and flagella-associated protein 206 [Arctopsyche grandis]|uniref:cilia- and flagella-associated protein 206 n=1 Tax=Arctopsyche grandis TaxID=121162 RepID=UPI00406DA210
MIERFIKLRHSIKKSLIDIKLDNIWVEKNISVLNEILELLKPIETAIEALSRRDTNILKSELHNPLIVAFNHLTYFTIHTSHPCASITYTKTSMKICYLRFYGYNKLTILIHRLKPPVDKMVFPNENTLKIIVAEVVKVCTLKSISLDNDFVQFYMKLVSLNPDNGRHFSKKSPQDELESFIDKCAEKISDEKYPSVLMMKMQFHFEIHYDSLENLVTKNQNSIDKRTQPLVNEIVQARPSTKEESEKLLRRISIYLVLKSGLGNPGNIQVLREGTAALNSIFNIDDLRAFVEQRNTEKEKQLSELLSVVSGIRIFNKDCGKGGESIPELIVNLSEAAEATSLALSHCLIRIMERVNLLTTAIDTYIAINPDTRNIDIIIPKSKNVDRDAYNVLCKILSVYRQYEILVRKLISDMEYVQASNKEICNSFTTQLNDLHTLVRYRTAIPTDQVFPYFVQLWYHWRKMQNNMFLISAMNNVMWNLDTAHEKMEVPHSIIDSLLDGRRIVSDAERIQRTEDNKIEHTFGKCQIVFLNENISDDFIYQYLGFCSLCLCTGALIPANPNMGLCKWGGKYYAFCVPEHGKQFGLNPNRYVKETLEYARNNVEMINFLQIYDEVYAVRQMPTLTIKHQESVKTEDKGVQTELHPIPTYIDKNYIWNIWDYKKKICQMANLVNCKTHSTQTHISASKVENSCQTNTVSVKVTEKNI